LYGDITVEDLKVDSYTSKLRNKLIAEAFYLTKDIEKYGTGFFRIRKEIKEYPTMYFECREQVGGFIAELGYVEQKTTLKIQRDTVNGTEVGTKVGTEVGTIKNELSIEILKEISTNNEVLVKTLALKLDVSRRTILRELNKLKGENKIFRIGTNRSGYWQINDDDSIS
jgi:ATP-dependent DNA helicase RecG